ncbi:MAG: RNA polymerase sigma factor [Bacteroidota bacterium]
MTNIAKQEFLAQYQQVHEAFVRYCASRAYGLLEVEDLVQETILATLEGFEKIKDQSRLLAYMIGIANNLTKRYSRRRKFKANWEEETIEKMEAQLKDAALAVDIHYLHQAIQQLGADQRDAILLFHISGLSVKEVAELQQVSEGAVKTRLSRGRTELKRLLADETHPIPLSKRLAIYASLF